MRWRKLCAPVEKPSTRSLKTRPIQPILIRIRTEKKCFRFEFLRVKVQRNFVWRCSGGLGVFDLTSWMVSRLKSVPFGLQNLKSENCPHSVSRKFPTIVLGALSEATSYMATTTVLKLMDHIVWCYACTQEADRLMKTPPACRSVKFIILS